MAYRLHSTLKPEGDLFPNHGEALKAMNSMLETLKRKGFRRVEYAVPATREGAMLEDPRTGKRIEVHISAD